MPDGAFDLIFSTVNRTCGRSPNGAGRIAHANSALVMMMREYRTTSNLKLICLPVWLLAEYRPNDMLEVGETRARCPEPDRFLRWSQKAVVTISSSPDVLALRPRETCGKSATLFATSLCTFVVATFLTTPMFDEIQIRECDRQGENRYSNGRMGCVSLPAKPIV